MPKNSKLMTVAADFYQLFGIQQDADITSVKRSYRRLAKEYHPDRNVDDPFAKELFQKINDAYSVLSDPVKRVHYDSLLNAKKVKRAEKSYAKQSIFDTIMNFGQEDTVEEDGVQEDFGPSGHYGQRFVAGSSPPNIYSEQPSANYANYNQPQIAAANNKNSFKLSSMPIAHYLCLFLIAIVFMLVPSEQARAGLALVWLFFITHAALSSWWIYRVRYKLPKDKVALGGLILMTHVLSAALSMLFLLPFLLVIYYMN